MNYYNLLHIGCRYGSAQGEPSIGSNNCKAFKGYMTFINMFNAVLPATDVSSAFNTQNYVSSNAGLLTIGNENDINYINNDRIALWPGSGAGFVGVNTQIPQYTLDISGSLNTNSDSTVGGNLFVTNNISTNSNLFVGSDVSFNQKLFVNSDVSINGMVSTGNLFVNGVQITSGGGNLSGNVQVGSNNGFVSIDKPYFYADPSLALYYNFDTSFNNGTKIYNLGYLGPNYDGSLNFNGGSTTGMIDTVVYNNGIQNNTSLASFANNPLSNNSGFRIGSSGSVPVSTAMTFSFWIYKKTRPASSSDFDRVFHFTDSTSQLATETHTIALDISSGGNIFPVITNSETSLITPSLPIISYDLCTSAWNHIVWTINGTNSNIYINGSLRQNDTLTQPIPGTTRANGVIAYSYTSVGGATRDFSGNIDDFRYYNGKALNYAEIYQLYNNNFYTLDICGGFLANGSSVIYETVGSRASANTGSLTLLHGDANGSSSIMFKASNASNDYAYIQYTDNQFIPPTYKWDLSSSNPTFNNNTPYPSTGVYTSPISFGPADASFAWALFSSTPGTGRPSSSNYCISFNQTNVTNGGTSRINYSTATVINSNNFSFSAWICPSIVNITDNYIIIASASDNIKYAFEIAIAPATGDTGSLQFMFNAKSANTFKISSNTALSANTWYHIACTYNDSTRLANIYINGSSNGSGTITDISSVYSYYMLHIGSRSGVGTVGFGVGDAACKGFRGYMAFLNFFNTVLTPAEVSTLYNNPNYVSSSDAGLLTIGNENDITYLNNDRISLWPGAGSGFVGVNTKTPQYTLDVSGTLNANSDALINGLTVGKGRGNQYANTAFGENALKNNIGGGQNTAIGYNTLFSNTFANQNIAIGSNALYKTTTGGSNVAIGTTALRNNISGNQNIAIGGDALNNNNLSNNIAIGFSALSLSTVGNTIAIGTNALQNNSTGTDNTAIGFEAMKTNTNGSRNIAIGNGALKQGNNHYNIGIGFEALSLNPGENNIAVGDNVLRVNVDGTQNVAIGGESLRFDVSGKYNTSIGYKSLMYGNVLYNTAIGVNAGISTFKGNYNTFLGGNTNITGNFTNSTAVGYGAQITASNQIRLGTDAEYVRCGIIEAVGQMTLSKNSSNESKIILKGDSNSSGNSFILANGSRECRFG